MSTLPAIASAPAASGAAAPLPVSESGKVDYKIDSKSYREKMTLIITATRQLFKIAEAVYATPKGGKVAFADGTQIGRKELNSYIADLTAELETMGKHFTASVGRGRKAAAKGGASNKGAQLKSLFYISDQLVGYLREANYGNGLAAAFEGQDASYYNINGNDPGTLAALAQRGFDQQTILGLLQAAEDRNAAAKGGAAGTVDASMLASISVQSGLDLVLNRRMATSGILISLLALITTVSDLQSKSNGQRIHYDATMLRHFDGSTNTRWILAREGKLVDVTPGSVPASAKDKDTFGEKLRAVNLSSFERLRRRPDTKIKRAGGEQFVPCFISQQNAAPGTDDWGLLHSMYMVLISHFRVPNELLTEAELRAIRSQPGLRVNTSQLSQTQIQAAERKLGFGVADLTLRQDQVAAVETAFGVPGIVQLVETNQNIIDAAQLQNWIHHLLEAHHVRTEPAKKAQRDQRRREAAAKKKASQPPKAKAGAAAQAAVPALLPLPLP
ncbi:Hypothetical protein POVN_LOCUS413 [uncultured virus]|nr:Hypothetical protein POVN_LOCUS413 [uncultured virus]